MASHTPEQIERFINILTDAAKEADETLARMGWEQGGPTPESSS